MSPELALPSYCKTSASPGEGEPRPDRHGGKERTGSQSARAAWKGIKERVFPEQFDTGYFLDSHGTLLMKGDPWLDVTGEVCLNRTHVMG